jgi:hypothetical protein
MGTLTATYAANATFTISLAAGPLATSSTLVAGRQSTSVDFSALNYEEVLISGKITTGTSPTAGGFIEVWWIPQLTDGTWPDTFGATDANVTISAREELAAYGFNLASIVNSSVSNHTYSFTSSLRRATGMARYSKIGCIWVVQSTSVALNGTAGNHSIGYMGVTAGY